MCGRYYYSDKGADSKNEVLIAMMEKYYRGKYKTGEIFPGDTVPAVIEQSGRLVPVPATFGFPGFAGGKLLINARAETASEKPTFREAWQKHRCVIPASWYCEWEHDEKNRPGQKYAIRPTEEGPVWLAGLYRTEDRLPAFVILTRPADDSLAWMHDRMPVMFTEEHAKQWICPEANPDAVIRECLTRTRWEHAG